jgi:hypothetical protein
MKDTSLISDQLYTGSEIYENKDECLPSKKKKDTHKQTAPPGLHPSGDADRAVQTLWKDRLQMCRRARSRSQILSIRKQTGHSPGNGLCASVLPRPSYRVFGEQPSCAESPRGDLRDQSRTDASQTASLKESCERRSYTGAQRDHRYHPRGDFLRQHASELACGLIL